MSAGFVLPPCPDSLKQIQHYLKTASEHETRDEVIAYWCRLYSLQTALKIDKKSDSARTLLVKLMDWLEQRKKELGGNEAITSEVVAQAHIENYALKLFLWATGKDKEGDYNKNVVKAYYTAAMLMDVLKTFGELSEELENKCKFAKWRAAHIHSSLRNGEIPEPAQFSPEDTNEEFDTGLDGGSGTSGIGFTDDFAASGGYSGQPTTPVQPSYPPMQPGFPSGAPPDFTPVQPSYEIPSYPEQPSLAPSGQVPSTTSSTIGAIKYDHGQISKAQKYCKWAGSALNYDDVPEAISNLEKALHLLRTGTEL